MHLINLIVIGLVFLLTLVYQYFKFAYAYWKSIDVPYVEPKIPYGNFKGFGLTTHPALVISDIYKKLKGSDKFFGIYFFVRPSAVLLDLDLIKNVLVKDFSNFDDRGLYTMKKMIQYLHIYYR